jgi:hypothetical protein
MPQVPQIAKEALLRSLQIKLLVYSENLRLRDPESDKAQRLSAEAIDLFAQGKLTALRSWAKEIDVWIRETRAPSEQELIAQEMKQAGVLPVHLPRTWSVVAARQILKRSAIRNEVDLSVVRVTLDSEGHGHLSQEDLINLGKLFDEYTVKTQS